MGYPPILPDDIAERLVGRHKEQFLDWGERTEIEWKEIIATIDTEWRIHNVDVGTLTEADDVERIDRSCMGYVHTHPDLSGYEPESFSTSDLGTALEMGYLFSGLIFGRGPGWVKDFYFYVAAWDTEGSAYRKTMQELRSLRQRIEDFNREITELADRYEGWEEVPQDKATEMWNRKEALEKQRTKLFTTIVERLIEAREMWRSDHFYLGRRKVLKPLPVKKPPPLRFKKV